MEEKKKFIKLKNLKIINICIISGFWIEESKNKKKFSILKCLKIIQIKLKMLLKYLKKKPILKSNLFYLKPYSFDKAK